MGGGIQRPRLSIAPVNSRWHRPPLINSPKAVLRRNWRHSIECAVKASLPNRSAQAGKGFGIFSRNDIFFGSASLLRVETAAIFSHSPSLSMDIVYFDLETERTAQEILNGVNEVSFNATLLKELRMIAVLRQVSDPGTSEGARWAEMRIHRVASDMLTGLGASSKLNAEWEFLTMLRDEGRRSAEEFLTAHASDLGAR